MGSTRLQFIQLGRETTGAGRGTEVDATVVWRGLGGIEDDLEIVNPEENVGYISGTTRQYIPKVRALLHMDEIEATFEQLPHIFEASIEREAGSADGAGSGYIYEYNGPTIAQPDVATYTIEGGDDSGEEQFTYGFVEEWTLSGTAGEAVMVEAEWVGREVAPGTKTAIVGLPVVEEILMSKGILSIDSTANAHGTTPVAAQWLEFELSYSSGLIDMYTGDGQKYFGFINCEGPEDELTVKLLHSTAAVAEKAAWRAGTVRKIRMDFTGTTVATSGTAYDAKHLIIDLSGKWEKWDVLDDEDGASTVEGTFIARYDPVTTHFFTATVVNTLASL